MKQRQIENGCCEKWSNVFRRRATPLRWGLATRWNITRSLQTDIPLAPQTRRYISRPNSLLSIRHPPRNYKSIKLWYILIVFLLPQNSLSSSSLFSTFILFISITIINIYFTALFFKLLSFPPPSVSSHSIIISIIITFVIKNINLHNQNLILPFVLLIPVQSLSPTTILSHSALHPFSFPQYKLPSKVKAAGFSSSQTSLQLKTSQKSPEGCHFNKNDTF